MHHEAPAPANTLARSAFEQGAAGARRLAMKVTVIGSGYVGLVTAACLADLGNDVVLPRRRRREDRACSRGPAADPRAGPGRGRAAQRRGRPPAFDTDAAAAARTARSSSSPSARRPAKTARPTCSTCWRPRASIGRHMDGLQGHRRQEHGAGRHRRRVRATSRTSCAGAASTCVAASSRTRSSSRKAPRVDDFMRPDRIVIGSDDAERDRR